MSSAGFLHHFPNLVLDQVPTGVKEVDSEAIRSKGFVFFHLSDIHLHFLKRGGLHEHDILIRPDQRGNVRGEFFDSRISIMISLSKAILIIGY